MSAEIESQVQSMLQSGVIEHSKTDILSPIVLARKRDGTQRFCLDFRSLNTELQDETFPLMTPTGGYDAPEKLQVLQCN